MLIVLILLHLLSFTSEESQHVGINLRLSMFNVFGEVTMNVVLGISSTATNC